MFYSVKVANSSRQKKETETCSNCGHRHRGHFEKDIYCAACREAYYADHAAEARGENLCFDQTGTQPKRRYRKSTKSVKKATDEWRRLAVVEPTHMGSPHRIAADNVNPIVASFCWIAMLMLAATLVFYERRVARQKQDAKQRGQLRERSSSLDRSNY